MKQTEYTGYAYGFSQGIKPEMPISLVDWSNEKRVLSSRASAEPGKWKTSRVPFMAEIMECLSVTSDVQIIALMKGTQIAGTEIGNNWCGYVVDHVPGPMMVVQPTIDLGKRWSRQRFTPMIDDMPCMAEKIADSRSRDSGNTLLSKEFDGGIIVVSGANSAASLRSMPVRYLFLDEVDGYPLDVDGEGDPVDLAINRTKTFSRKKIYMPSTPTTSGLSRIEREFLAGDQCFYHLPCPHCCEYQKLEWSQISWDKTPFHEPETAIYICKHNGCIIQEHNKPQMLAAGKWIAENSKAPKHRRSFHLSSLYSPLGWGSWAEVVEKFLESKDNVEKLKTWTNTALAQTWKEEINDITGTDLLANAENFELGTVQPGGLILTAGVDTQDNRLEAYVYAWGEAEQGWLVNFRVFYGDPGGNKVWDDLASWLWDDGFKNKSGRRLKPEKTNVDTGGHFTHEAYMFCRQHKKNGAVAIAGSNKHGGPIICKPSLIDISFRGRVIKNGVQLWRLGVDTAKTTLYSRYKKSENGTVRLHYPDTLPIDIFDQLTAEKKIKRYTKGRSTYIWDNSRGASNEALDCLVYAYSAALMIGIDGWSKRKWEEKKQQIEPDNLDIFDFSEEEKVIAKTIPKKAGFKDVEVTW